MRGVSTLLAAAALAVGSMVAAAPASAAAFGPASLGFSFPGLSGPSYALNAASGTLTFGHAVSVTSASGTLTSVTSGTSGGTITFSKTVGMVMAQAVSSLFTFTSPTAGTFTYDLQYVDTTSYSYDVSQDTLGVSLYLFGIMAGGNAGYSGTATSIAFDTTGFGGFTLDSATLRNPPDADPNAPPVPPPSVSEPAGWLAFAAGLGGMVVCGASGWIGWCGG